MFKNHQVSRFVLGKKIQPSHQCPRKTLVASLNRRWWPWLLRKAQKKKKRVARWCRICSWQLQPAPSCARHQQDTKRKEKCRGNWGNCQMRQLLHRHAWRLVGAPALFRLEPVNLEMPRAIQKIQAETMLLLLSHMDHWQPSTFRR